jgi:glycerol-3-phosphate dehydrogenase
MSFSNADRNKNLLSLQNDYFDIAIIGGGIIGAGIARDAASRGMKVALVEVDDFASGTSSRSSKLIHGGIRYLENFEFGLVFEALTERRNLFEIAPHLVHPLRFVLPVYENARVGMFKMGLGMWAYDALSMFEAPELHERLNSDDTQKRVPMLNAKLNNQLLEGSYVYSDAYMDDDRLVIETLRSAVKFGATAVNYLKATGAEIVNGKMQALICEKDIKIRAKHFVSSVGPWTDIVANNLLNNWKKIMRPTKGVHLTFSRDRLPLNEAVVMISDDQKRIVFAIPRHEMVIVGTTDTDFSGDPKDVCTTQADIDYLLKVSEGYFPGAKLTQEDIIASYSGVRPLVDDGSQSESKTSREHLIVSDPRNITFVTGGKYTTYRKIAEDVTRSVLEQFTSEERMRWSHSRTLEPLNLQATEEKIFQAKRQCEVWAREFGVDVGTVNFLVDRHGEEAKTILQKYAPLYKKTVHIRWQIEACHAIQETMCLSLRDFYLRRVPLFLANENHGFHLLNEIAGVFQNQLGWTEAVKLQQIELLKMHMQSEMGWKNS